MRTRTVCLALLACVAFGACSDDGSVYRPEPGNGPGDYPVTLRPLSEPVLAERLARFRERNPGG